MQVFGCAKYRQSAYRLLHAARLEYDRALAAARAQLDEAAWNAAWAEGRAMTLEQAVTYALEDAG